MGDSGSSVQDDYLLPRGGSETTRLTYQHYALTQRQGWLLHPDITNVVKPSNDDVRILDLATGNAVWAFDIARQYPDAEIIGLDMSDFQYPPAFTRPANVTLDLYNLLDPVPDKYYQYFDVVNVRMLVAAIYSMDKDALVKKILSMLKPGGWLQWSEIIKPMGLRVNKDLQVSREMLPLFTQMFQSANFEAGSQWAAQLPETLEQEYGLEAVVGLDPPIAPASLPMETECIFWSVKELMSFAARAGKPGAKEVADAAIRVRQEILATGDMMAYSWIVVVGRKPA